MSQVESGETRGASCSWQVEECQLPLTCTKVIIIIVITKVIVITVITKVIIVIVRLYV